ncbi:MAG: c-type cytochrome [Algicola sp.]|nr:c-type cytochrome [Algicola sp.]
MQSRLLMRIATFVICATLAIQTPITLAGSQDFRFADCHWPDKSIKLTGKSCGVFEPPQISCVLPWDVQGKLKDKNLNNTQRASNLFAWQTFMALNWPAKKHQRGVPASHKAISNDAPRVWESYKTTAEVFLDNGQRPSAWDSPRAKAAPNCQSTTLLYAADQPTFTNGALPGTLTAQNTHRTRYDIHYNKTAFDYIVKNKLYDTHQQAVVQNVDFPNGSILVKPAWLPLSQAQQQSKDFYTIKACVCDPQPPAQVGDPLQNCKDQKVGLTGLHVMTKTKSAPQWIWSTFEHKDNVTTTYHNDNCSASNPCAPDNQQTPEGTPNQVTREIKIPDTPPNCDMPQQSVDDVATLNKDVKHALKKAKSVFKHYELIDTQWPVVRQNQPPSVFGVFPSLLSNTTLETYIQDTSSCMGCHAMARTQRHDQYVSADFTFSLSKALPLLPNPYRVTTPSSAPSTKQASIERGHDLVTQTYELLPKNVVAKLHCTSCHLDGGGDPAASWWVGMDSAYEIVKVTDKVTDEVKILNYPDSLQHRINGCFTRSMNGNPLCEPGDDCNKNKDMTAIIDYMQSLTDNAKGKFGGEARGFALLPVLTGNQSHGKSTYLQKCAFCHGAEGQGHYSEGESGEEQYYRPALWGANSFNACAGMAKTSKLAPFIKANMPFEFGGAITNQEAWDLATFIDAQCRPGKAGCSETTHCVNGVDKVNVMGIRP